MVSYLPIFLTKQYIQFRLYKTFRVERMVSLVWPSQEVIEK